MEDAGTAEVIRGKMALLQQNLDDVNRYWDEQTDGLHAAPDGKIYTRDGELYMNPDGTKPEGKKSKRKSDKLADQVYFMIILSPSFPNPHVHQGRRRTLETKVPGTDDRFWFVFLHFCYTLWYIMFC